MAPFAKPERAPWVSQFSALKEEDRAGAASSLGCTVDRERLTAALGWPMRIQDSDIQHRDETVVIMVSKHTDSDE